MCVLILLNVIADVSLKESYLQCLMLWLIYIFCCLLWVLCFKLLIMVWELKDLISDCCFCLTGIFGRILLV